MTQRVLIIGLSVIATLVVLFIVRLALLSVSSKAPDTLGVDGDRLATCPESPNCVSSQAEDAAHRVEPIAAPGLLAEAMARAVSTIEAMPGTRVVAAEGRYLHAEFTSRLFRFVDDLELFWDGDREVFEVRSASRVGYSDLGANRKRVAALRARLAG